MAQVLVPAPRLDVLTTRERTHLGRLVAAGAALGPALGAEAEAAMRAQRLVFRRWLLEAILALRVAPAPLRANVLARELGVRGQTFAVKTRELRALDAARRLESDGHPPAVAYALTPLGRDLGSFALALTAYKALQCDAARSGQGLPVEVSASDADGDDIPKLLADARVEAEALQSAYVAARGADIGATELRRYAETCVRRWHPAVLVTLTGRPHRFRALAAATGAGDEALSRALRSLTALGAVATTEDGYAITAWGRGDLALGALLVAALVAAKPPAIRAP